MDLNFFFEFKQKKIYISNTFQNTFIDFFALDLTSNYKFSINFLTFIYFLNNFKGFGNLCMLDKRILIRFSVILFALVVTVIKSSASGFSNFKNFIFLTLLHSLY